MAMEMSERYSCLSQGPQPMEIVLLMGRGCFWKKCRFCDYYDDAGEDAVSIPLDSLLFSWIAFGGLFEAAVVWSIFFSNTIIKFATTLVSLPAIYLVKDREHTP